MAQSKILIDTNSYLRLANRIHPLLATAFGESLYCLYCIPELNRELESRRLLNKFPWIDEDSYYQNRQMFPVINRKQSKSINDTYEFIWAYVQSEFPGPSRVDTRFISYALELEIPIVTDDQDMTELAKLYGVEIISTIALLRLMVDGQHITIKVVDGLLDYWRYLGDRPANMDQDYARYFPK